MPSPSSLFKLENLVCGYPGFKLKDISLKILPGDFTAILGPNGCGKTTLFKAMTADLPCLEGEITFCGKPADQIPRKEMARTMAIVTQSQHDDNPMTVEEFVFMGRLPYLKPFQFFEGKKDQEKVEEVLSLTGILPFRKRLISELSGGERQMAIIARALAQEPRILLLDEPTNHLDIAHQVRILDLLKKLNREKELTILIVLHDLNLASEYCSRLILMNQGRLHCQGTSKEVLTFQNIEEVFNTVVLVRENPVSQKPCIFLVSQEEKEKSKQRRESL